MLRCAKMAAIAAVSVAAALAGVSCGNPQSNPLVEAVKAKVAETVKGNAADVRINSIELIDSSALGPELSRCKDLFSLKIKRETELYDKYLGNGQRSAAQAKRAVIAKAQQNYEGIEALEQRLAASKDSIIAYHYRLAGRARNADGGSVIFNEAYVAVTPDGRVLTLVTDRRDLGKVVRHAIPGYMELLGAEE